MDEIINKIDPANVRGVLALSMRISKLPIDDSIKYGIILIDRCRGNPDSIIEIACMITHCAVVKYAVEQLARETYPAVKLPAVYGYIFRSIHRDIRSAVYMLNSGLVEYKHMLPFYNHIYLRAGAGILLIKYPEMLNTTWAAPYMERIDHIKFVLKSLFIPELYIIIADYLSYEIPELPCEIIQDLHYHMIWGKMYKI